MTWSYHPSDTAFFKVNREPTLRGVFLGGAHAPRALHSAPSPNAPALRDLRGVLTNSQPTTTDAMANSYTLRRFGSPKKFTAIYCRNGRVPRKDGATY